MSLRRWQIRTFLAFTIVHPLYYLGRYNYVAVLPVLMKEFNLSHAMVGSLATVLTLTYAFGQLINGFLADRYGPRLMLSLGAIASTIMNIVTGFSTTFTGIMIAWGLNGYFQAMGWNSVCRLSANWFPQNRRGLSLSFVDAACSVVTGVIPVLGAIIIVDYGWRGVFWFPPLVLALAGIAFYLMTRNKPTDVGLVVDWSKEDRGENLSFFEQLRFSYGGAFADWRMIMCYGVYGCTQFCRFGLITWLPIYLFETTGRTLLAATLVASIYQFGSIGSHVLLGWASDRFKRTPIIIFALLMAAIALFALTYFPSANFALLTVIFIVAGLGTEAIEIPLMLLPIDVLGDDRAATTTGAMNCVGKLGATVQGVLLGFLIDGWGYKPVFTLMGLISLLGIGLIIPIRRSEHV